MEIVRIFSANESLYRGKNCSPNTIYLYYFYAISFQISVPNRHPPSNPREICRESRGMYRLWTDRYSDIEGENSGLIRQRRTYAPFALDRERGRKRSKGEIWPIEISNQWVNTHRERERERERERGREREGNYARYIFPPSRVIGIPEARTPPTIPRAALTTFVSGRGWSVLRRRVPSSLCRCRWGVWRRDNETRSIQLDFK